MCNGEEERKDMHKCNCVATYYSQTEEYVIGVSMIKNGFNRFNMLWDTGAGYTVVYLNLLKKIKSISEHDLKELETLLSYKNRDKSRYVSKVFGSALKDKSIGILCCAHNVHVNHLCLENFYFFVLPADNNKNRGLLGADFISCCKRECNIGTDEIFTSFDDN